jgi:putative transposase
LQEGLRTIGDHQALEKIVTPRANISMRRQCVLLGLTRSNLYYRPAHEKPENLEMMRSMDEEFMEHPNKGVEAMVDFLCGLGFLVGPKRVRRLLRKMGVMAIYPKRNLSKLGLAKYVFPYMLRKLEITHSNHVWCIDITYIPMRQGFLYLTAIIDVYSRYVVGWSLANSLDGEHSLKVLRKAIVDYGKPAIINSDQGSQFTREAWIEYLRDQEIDISMDGRGRCLDNIWVERLWRTVKQEYIYLNPAEDGKTLHKGLKRYLDYYNNRRTHQSLERMKPADWYEYAA